MTLREIEDRAFRFFAESFDVKHTKTHCLADPMIRAHVSELTFQRAAYCVGSGSSELLEELRREPSPLGKSLVLFFWIFKADCSDNTEHLGRVEDDIFALYDGAPSPLDVSAIQLLQGQRLIAEGDLLRARELLWENLKRVRNSAFAETAKSLVVECGLSLALASRFRRSGELSLSSDLVKAADRVCQRGNLIQSLQVTLQRGNVAWLMGDYKLGLRMHRCDRSRRKAEGFQKHYWLLGSHLLAAKNALDLGRIELAESELERADQYLTLLGQNAGVRAHYYKRYLAELRCHQQRLDEVVPLIERAIKGFESLDDLWGKLDTTIAMASFHYIANDQAPRSDVVLSLRQRIAECGFADLKARAFRYESLGFLTSRPPHREFHSVRSQASAEMAASSAHYLDGLSNLMKYSLRHFKRRDTTLLGQIKELKPQVYAGYYQRVQDELDAVS